MRDSKCLSLHNCLMKSLILQSLKSPLIFSEHQDPQPANGESLVELRAAALNRRDYWITQGMYPGVKTPCILGSDGSGVIGDREVILCPSLNWGTSETAQGGDYQILGMPRNGTFAEQIAYPSDLIYDKPPRLSFEEAAALPLAGLTAFRALIVQAGLRVGQKLLISGIGGGVATFGLQFALAVGVEVYVTSSSEEKLAKAKSLGAIDGANYRDTDWAKGFLKSFGKMDVILDSAGGKGYNDLLKILKPGGCIVNYGSTAGPPAELDLFTVFWNQIRIIGSTMGSPRDFESMLDLVIRHDIHPVIDRTESLENGPELIASMASMPQFGKLALKI